MAAAATPRSTVELDIEDTVKVWPQRRDTWMYVSVADEHTARIDAIFEADPRGFRSVPVTAELGTDRWDTALFRYQDGTWALPLKAPSGSATSSPRATPCVFTSRCARDAPVTRPASPDRPSLGGSHAGRCAAHRASAAPLGPAPYRHRPDEAAGSVRTGGALRKDARPVSEQSTLLLSAVGLDAGTHRADASMTSPCTQRRNRLRSRTFPARTAPDDSSARPPRQLGDQHDRHHRSHRPARPRDHRAAPRPGTEVAGVALTGQALDGLTAALTGSEALDVAGVAAITSGLVGRPLRRVVVLDEQ